MIEPVKISDHISYIPASEEPLSADVVLINGAEYLYVFDVGNKEQVAEYLNSIPKKKRVILSHFHTDHMGNIGRVNWESVFFGANTEKYFQHYIADYAEERFSELPQALAVAFEGKHDVEDTMNQHFPRYVTTMKPIRIEDGISIEIHPLPNSHAKGSLLLQVDNQYIFVGDSLYAKAEGDSLVYNTQLLKEEIELLLKLPGETIFGSHEKNPLKRKLAAVRFLQSIYVKRQKGESYIRVTGKD